MRVNDLRPHLVLEHDIGVKTHLGILREKEARARRRKRFLCDSSLFAQDLARKKNEKGLGLKCKRDLRYEPKP